MEFFVDFFFYSTLNMSCHCLLASIGFCVESVVNLTEPLHMMSYISHFIQDSMALVFDSLIIMCLLVDLLEFIFLGVHCDSWMHRLFFIKTGKFFTIISVLFLFISPHPWVFCYTYVIMLNHVPQVS